MVFCVKEITKCIGIQIQKLKRKNISEGEEDGDAKDEENDDAEKENNDDHDIYVRKVDEEMNENEVIEDIDVMDDKMNKTFQNPSQSDKTKNDNKAVEAPTYEWICVNSNVCGNMRSETIKEKFITGATCAIQALKIK